MLKFLIKTFFPNYCQVNPSSQMSSSSLQFDPLAERMKRLLYTCVDADVHFLVGQGDEQELIHAHKPILRIASDVFDAMFRFDEAKQKKKDDSSEVSDNGHVLIPDIDVEAFKTMLDFIYTNDVSRINGKNAIDLLYAAKKYNLPMLAKACVDIPISKLDNVFIAFAKARLLEEKDFAGRCLAYIDRNADTLIKSDEFLQIDQKLLCELLGRDQLVVTEEITIWNAALRWADEQCRQKGLDYSPENRRQVLGSALFQIRFPIIPKDFLKDIVSSCVLTSAELVAVLLYYSLGDSSNVGAKSQLYPLPFSIRHRSAEFTLKIKKFSEFSKANETHREYSEAVSIGGFKWRIYAKIVTESDTKYLGLYLYCHNHGSNWSCPCSATLRILSQKQGKVDFAWTFDHTFQSNKKIWGLPRFKSFMEVINTSNGWYMEKEDTVILSANVTVKE